MIKKINIIAILALLLMSCMVFMVYAADITDTTNKYIFGTVNISSLDVTNKALLPIGNLGNLAYCLGGTNWVVITNLYWDETAPCLRLGSSTNCTGIGVGKLNSIQFIIGTNNVYVSVDNVSTN